MPRNDEGFTLIELLIVVAIIGILAAIALPQYAEYRKRSFDSRAVHDLRNAATAEEAYFIDTEEYISCSDVADCEASLPGFIASADVALSVTVEGQSFIARSSHPQGDVDEFVWDSDNGGLQ